MNTVPYRRATTSSAMTAASSGLFEKKRCSSGTTLESARRTRALTCFALAFSRTATAEVVLVGVGANPSRRSAVATIWSIGIPWRL